MVGIRRIKVSGEIVVFLRKAILSVGIRESAPAGSGFADVDVVVVKVVVVEAVTVVSASLPGGGAPFLSESYQAAV